MSRFFFRPYVPVAQRRAQALKKAAKLAREGKILSPILIDGRTIASTFWGKAWCNNLESYSDYENRLPRGRTYVRNGSVIDLQIASGQIDALVQGSSLYKVAVVIAPLAPKRWKTFVKSAAGKIANLFDLLQGRLSKDLLTDITRNEDGLFPTPKEIKLSCSCPDWAVLCKHVAAVLYGVGARLDSHPELFFTLRGVKMEDLLSAAGKSAAVPLAADSGPAIAAADLSDIFGVEIEDLPIRVQEEAAVKPASTKAKAKKALRKTPKPKDKVKGKSIPAVIRKKILAKIKSSPTRRP